MVCINWLPSVAHAGTQMEELPSLSLLEGYGKPFEHLFNILDMRLKVHILVSFLSSLVR